MVTWDEWAKNVNERLQKLETGHNALLGNVVMQPQIKYQIERIGFYIRPIKEWFWPSQDDQRRLKKMLAEGAWILGNKQYEPMIELNTTQDEIDDNSWQTLEEHKATPKEIERIGKEGWVNL